MTLSRFHQHLAALALTLAAATGAQATVISASAGQSLIFNFSAPVGAAERVNIDYVANSGAPIGKVTFFADANLGGGAWLSSAPGMNLLDLPSMNYGDTPLMDGFSLLVEVTSGVFTAGRDGKDTLQAIYRINNGGNPPTYEVVAATLGTDSRVATHPSVPEPSSLLLAGLAGTALVRSRRR